MNKVIQYPKWWHYLATFLLIITLATVLFYIFGFCVFSKRYSIDCNLESAIKWIINTGYFAHDSLGFAIGLSYLTSLSIGATWWLTGIALIGVATGWLLKYPLHIYIWMFAISILPMASLIVLHFMGI